MDDLGRFAQRASRARRLIGGPAATSWPVLGLMAGMLLLDRLGTDLERTGQPLLLVSSALVGALTIVGVLRLARLTLLRDVTLQPHALTTILLFLVAASGAAFTGRIHDGIVGLPVDGSPVHIFERTGWGFTVLLLLSMCVTSVTGHRTELAAQTDRARTLQRTRDEVDALLSTAVAAELAAVTAEIRAELAKLDGADVDSAISSLRHVGLQLVRSRSHALAEPSPPYRASERTGEPAPPGLAELAADVTADRPIRPAFPAAMVALWGTAITLADDGLLGALIVGSVLGLIALVVWGSFGLAVDRALSGRRIRTRVIIVAVTMLTAAAGWVAAAEAWEQVSGLMLPTAETPVQRAAQALIMTLFAIVQVLSQALRRRGEHALLSVTAYNAALEAEVSRANTELWAQRRELSAELHGWVQASVNAATMRVSDAARQGCAPEAVLVRACADIEEALVALERKMARGGRSDSAELERAIARICGLWEGLVDIQVDLPEQLDVALEHDLTMQAALVEALTEACSNAVRHGAASRIHARITPAARVVRLEVVDDGRAVGHGVPGQGSALLDAIALDWRRTRDDAGTRLSASFARP